MRERRFAIGCIIIFLTIGVIALLYANYSARLTDILKESASQCEKDDNKCFNKLKTDILYSDDAKIAMAYTGGLTLLVLIGSLFAFNRYCAPFDEKKESRKTEYSGEIKKVTKKINNKWLKK